MSEYIDNIKNVPITDYALRIGMSLTRIGKYYSIKGYDSVRIDPSKNAFWRNSRFSMGSGDRNWTGSVIDFAIAFGGCADAKSAIKEIAEMYGIERSKDYKAVYQKPIVENEAKPKRKAGEVKYPEKASNNNKAWRYLFHERKINNSVLKYFVAKKMLYQDTHDNCVFNTERFACMRSTWGKKFAIDAEGCDYKECFFFKGKNASDTLVVAESVIDIMSIMTVMCDKGLRYVDYSYLALTGTNKIESIFYHLDNEPQIKKIALCFDNDTAGENAYNAVVDILKEKYSYIQFKKMTSPQGKDWNEYLQIVKEKEQ